MSASASVMPRDTPRRRRPRPSNRNHMWRKQFPRIRVPESYAACAPQCPHDCPWRTEEDTCRVYRGHVSESLKLQGRVSWRGPCRMLEFSRMDRANGSYDYRFLEASLGLRGGIQLK